ncbi:MAG: hypothetical protein A2W99_04500 [Bacteroidetes bacterium GWF2_33_16]|nr:MAG: hypothetical protein A2X00_17020 [Bacteroidetes bacterium GWE2_32_14]OFY05930.1 MAG: hypothetical protein A2W99_04500 [Bacteroidetes bacterium GWF2_33_16]
MEYNSKNNILAIFNGRNFKNKRVDKLLLCLNNNSADYIFTSKKDHIIEILREKNDYKGYLLFGGDGTIHETINQLIGSDKWISFFPGGTVNCIAGYFKMKRTIPFMQSFLQNNQTKLFDLIKVDFHTHEKIFTKHILGFLTIGHLANMTITAEKFRWMPRFIRYPFVGFLSFFKIHKFEINYSIDQSHKKKKKATSIIINNCGAERFSSLQHSDFSDGKYEFLIENHSHLGQIASIYSQYFSLSSKSKWVLTEKPLTITFNEPQPVMADGEIYTNILRIDLTICPSIQKINLPGRD